MELENILKSVKEATFKAGQEILKIYKTDFKVRIKGDKEPVTQADIRSNKILAAELKVFGYPILSEEAEDNNDRLKARRVWIIDPMDGTKDFIEKTGDFSIMVALVEKGEPVLGVVYRPSDSTWYYGMKGKGSFKDEKEGKKKNLSVSEQKNIRKAGILLSRFHLSKDIVKFSDDLKINKRIPSGSLGLKLSYIAERKGDITINTSNHPHEWDICAGDIILSEAGGLLTDMIGKKYVYNKKDTRNWQGMIATNKALHQEIVEYFKK